jgi:hypothetical protein
MAKIAKLDIDGGFSMGVAQLKDDLVINRQVYDLNNLYPQPFKNMCFNGQGVEARRRMTGTVDHYLGVTIADHLSTHSTNWLSRGRRAGNFIYGSNFMVDSDDSNIGYYMLPEGVYNDDGVIIYKVNLLTKEIIMSGRPGGNGFTAHLVSQDASYVYYTYVSTASSYAYLVCGSFNKSTFTNFHQVAQSPAHWRYTQPIYMTEDSNMLWMLFSAPTSSTNHSYYTLNKGTGNWITTPIVLQTSPKPTGMDCHSIPSQTRVIDADNDAAYTAWPTSNTTNVYEIYKYNVNKSLQTMSSDICTLDFTTAGVTRSDVLHAPTSNDNSNLAVEAWMVTGGSSDYVCVSLSEHATNSIEPGASFKIYIFKIETTDTNLTYIGQIDPAIRVRTVMPLEENWSKIASVYDGGLKIYDWNAGTETYDYVDAYAADIEQIMIDTSERIWIMSNSGELHMFSATTPIRVTVIMQNETYNYTGSTINTYANVSAWNTDGNRVVANVKLVLEGSAEFTDVSKSKTFATSASADTQISINITGSSYSRAVASVVV